MKMKLAGMLAALLGAAGSVHAQDAAQPMAAGQPDPKFYVFLAFGQSNMEGFPRNVDAYQNADPRFKMLAVVDFPKMDRKKGEWYTANPPLCRPGNGLGPADYFGRTLVANLPQDIKVGVTVVAVGGCDIKLFNKETEESYSATAPQWMKGMIKAYDGSPYDRLVEAGKKAKQAGVIKGILLHQGETNNGQKDWPEKVNVIYQNLLKDLDLKAEDVPLLAGGMVPADQKGACAGMNRIIADIGKTIPTAHYVPSDQCEGGPDHLHFTAKGYEELGKRYGLEMLKLLGVSGDAVAPTYSAPATTQPAAAAAN